MVSHTKNGIGIIIRPTATVALFTLGSRTSEAKLNGTAGIHMSAMKTPTMLAAPLPPRNRRKIGPVLARYDYHSRHHLGPVALSQHSRHQDGHCTFRHVGRPDCEADLGPDDAVGVLRARVAVALLANVRALDQAPRQICSRDGTLSDRPALRPRSS